MWPLDGPNCSLRGGGGGAPGIDSGIELQKARNGVEIAGERRVCSVVSIACVQGGWRRWRMRVKPSQLLGVNRQRQPAPPGHTGPARGFRVLSVSFLWPSPHSLRLSPVRALVISYRDLTIFHPPQWSFIFFINCGISPAVRSYQTK